MKSTSERLATVPWALVTVVFLIALLGVYNLHSSAHAHDPDLYLKQVIWLFGGTVMVVLLVLVDYRLVESMAYILYGVVCLFLLAVLVEGNVAGGARRWLTVGPLTFQPSEPAKIATVVCLARYFARRPLTSGYSLATLLRPLNASRPIACGLLVAVFWRNPWLADPLGELARRVHQKPLAPFESVLWFRVLLLVGIVLVAAGLVFLYRAIQDHQALLDPWPKGRLKRLVVMTAALAVALAALLLSQWHAALLQDPVGWVLHSLHGEGAPGGLYGVPQDRWALRAGLVFAVTLYLVAALAALRRPTEQAVDRLIAPLDLLFVPALLILVQPDLGTAGIVILVGVTMVLVVGVQFRSLLVMAAMGAVLSAVAWTAVLKDYQKRRILNFIDPEHDAQGSGWNAVQSMIAIGSGRWWGKGHMAGTQTQLSFLPEQHTDFAFSVWGEEQGFIGCLLVVFLYVLLVVFALTIAARARDAYGTLIAVGVTAIVLWQAFINIGMVIGALPVVGLTLPLFSYGGSSVLTVMIGLGLLINVHMRRHSL